MSKNKNKVEGKLIKLGEDKYDLLIDFDPNLLKGCKLSLENCQAIERGYDLDELAYDFSWNYQSDPHSGNTIEVFKKGFEKAIEIIGDKKFTLDDIYTVFIMGREGMEYEMNRFVDRIHEPTEWSVEVMTRDVYESDGIEVVRSQKPKLDFEGSVILKRI